MITLTLVLCGLVAVVWLVTLLFQLSFALAWAVLKVVAVVWAIVFIVRLIKGEKTF